MNDEKWYEAGEALLHARNGFIRRPKDKISILCPSRTISRSLSIFLTHSHFISFSPLQDRVNQKRWGERSALSV